MRSGVSMDSTVKKQVVTLLIVGVAFSAMAPLAGGLVESARIRQMATYGPVIGNVICMYAGLLITRAKRQPWPWALLGAFSCIGIAILWFVLPDKSAEARPAA